MAGRRRGVRRWIGLACVLLALLSLSSALVQVSHGAVADITRAVWESFLGLVLLGFGLWMARRGRS